jgi:hypothetical protein
MTKKFHIIVLTAMFGFFLIPSIASACEMNSGKSCCGKEMTTSNEKKDCCQKANHSNEKKNEGCGGNAKHSSCHCSILQINVILPIETKNQVFAFVLLDKKDKFIDRETPISSGFSSIWLIPKIG